MDHGTIPTGRRDGVSQTPVYGNPLLIDADAAKLGAKSREINAEMQAKTP